ncbi:dynein heavy chain [Anaeramoeba flamelloides]|uniref:Dynein heavy chain, cytoplasmic n=1 Tax=Anaeramoeba flamelloides TaxID=1746091 RepID=A0AAV8ADU6_9EUKA|nr:dynein heavy chain [Anaeramoeba flamelloides]
MSKEEIQDKKFEPIDLERLTTYLENVTTSLFGTFESEERNKLVINLIRNNDTETMISKFAFNKDSLVIAFNNELVKIKKINEKEEERYEKFNISLGVEYNSKTLSTIIFIKRIEMLVEGVNLSQQIQVVHVSEGSPFKVLHRIVHNSLSPYVNSFAKFEVEKKKTNHSMDKQLGNDETEEDQKRRNNLGGMQMQMQMQMQRQMQTQGESLGVPVVKKKLVELETAFLQFQQNVDIPKIHLKVEEEIIKCVQKNSKSSKQKKPSPKDLGKLYNDTNFLNRVQSGVNKWIRDIQKVTRTKRDPLSGTAEQEIKFWGTLKQRLTEIADQVNTGEVVLTLELLRVKKRHIAGFAFETDTGLNHALKKVTNYNNFMKYFPIQDILTAEDFQKLQEAVEYCFNHLKKIRLTNYPLYRVLRFVELISKDIISQLLTILGREDLMNVGYKPFETATKKALMVIKKWNDSLSGFYDTIRELERRQREEKFALKLNSQMPQLEQRLKELGTFRRQHEELEKVIKRLLPQRKVISELDLIEELKRAFKILNSINVLDLSNEGSVEWKNCLREYDKKIDNVEGFIIENLRERLANVTSANEMFRVFSKFNVLFFRKRIKGAIQEYQTQLIYRVKDDIKKLHDKFDQQYENTRTSKMTNLRGLPPVSGKIIWLRQIENQLINYMNRIGDVLGKDWEQQPEGKKLKIEGEKFRLKFDCNRLFNEWIEETKSKNWDVVGPIFEIVQNHNQTGSTLEVTFKQEIVTLFKEVRNLVSLNFRVPFNINFGASSASQLYPFAISLVESIKNYFFTCDSLDEKIKPLIASYQNEVQEVIQNGCSLTWNDHKLELYVTKLSNKVILFEEKVENLKNKYTEINDQMQLLETCKLDQNTMINILNQIQENIDQFDLQAFSNLSQWVKKLDHQIEEILAKRLIECLNTWNSKFESFLEEIDYYKKYKSSTTQYNNNNNDNNNNNNKNNQNKSKNKNSNNNKISNSNKIRRKKHFHDEEEDEEDNLHKFELDLPTITYSIKIKNRVIYLDPPIKHVRQTWIEILHDTMGVVCERQRLDSTRYTIMSPQSNDKINSTYNSIISKIPRGLLKESYNWIEKLIKQVKEYVTVWFQYQSLWDIKPDMIEKKIGNDLQKWQALLLEVKKYRSTFDTSESTKQLGPIIIDYSQVQSQVSNKYDFWHKEFLQRFSVKLGSQMRLFWKKMNDYRRELSKHSLESDSTSDIVSFVTQVTSLKKNSLKWEQELELFRNGELILDRQWFRLDENNWLYYDQVESEWLLFSEILNKQDETVNKQVPILQTKIEQEDQMLNRRYEKFLNNWKENKPLDGKIIPSMAIERLQTFEQKINDLKQDFEKLSLARESLNMFPGKEINFESISGELNNLKQVWNELTGIWKMLQTLKETPWTAVIPQKIRVSLDEQYSALRKLPKSVRQYDAYSHFSSIIKGFLRCNILIQDLRSEVMKERHWKQLQNKLNVTWKLNELTLGDIYDADLIKNEVIFKDVISIAGGELALEKFLSEQVRQHWNNFVLELVNYQNKTKLIKGWDDIFGKLGEHINSLRDMKNSPYFKHFEEECFAWEEKLNKILLIFDPWLDVQMKWVDLEGVFMGSSDIKQLLPQESLRFDSIDLEFVQLMKKVQQKPLILDVIKIEGLQKTVERLKEMLIKVQKALGQYLEKQRAAFPRFYFVGDPDLLEIIGNSKDITKIQRHFKKMFAGIESIKLSEDESLILGMKSKEECIEFPNPIKYKEYTKINEWMKLIELQMRKSLIIALERSLKEYLDLFNKQTHQILAKEFLHWINKTPDQIAILTLQIIWTNETENAIHKKEKGLQAQLGGIIKMLGFLANQVLLDLLPLTRTKIEHLTIELVHQRDVLRKLINNKITSLTKFNWLKEMRFYWHPENNSNEKLMIHLANAKFHYGFEYLGVPGRLVITPLTDRTYLTLTQALHLKLGGNPFGPAGTGKTETVKSLGYQLGRFVLVFNCDETFDFQAMGRIFVGLCSTGAWGCFDEFNRLEEKMLSAVSQQIQTIQVALKNEQRELDLVERHFTIDPDMGIFITMNPGYAGRSNLPDNLKQLFRSIAMIKPDRELIAEVMLYSQGFKTAEGLSGKAVPLFKLCASQLSKQTHYDFGLRALKSVLVSAGKNKRAAIQELQQQQQQEKEEEKGKEIELQKNVNDKNEILILLKSICETVIPKLVSEDILLFGSLLKDVFPGLKPKEIETAELTEKIKQICKRKNFLPKKKWLQKILQLYQIQRIHHGVMLVGPSGSGKTAAWRVLHEALQDPKNKKFGEFHIIDPKAISKEELYGVLDPTTREWTDGILTHILRKIVNNVRGEAKKFHWIIFDGDVSTDWIENLNSVLDDNKLLTLPNGERIELPDNVKIMFEVENLKYATPATVSRCGMVWFSENVVSPYMVCQNFLGKLTTESVLQTAEENLNSDFGGGESTERITEIEDQKMIVDIVKPYFEKDNFVIRALKYIEEFEHIMQFTKLRLLTTLFSIFKRSIEIVHQYNQMNEESQMTMEHLKKYITKKLLYSVLWGFSGSTGLRDREKFGKYIVDISDIKAPMGNFPLIDYKVDIQTGEWYPWKNQVPNIDIETNRVAASDFVITTIDTLRHEDVVYAWLHDHLPLILCGPAGSGKTMTLNATLKSFPDYELVGINFSSATSPAVIMRTLNQYCSYTKTPNGMVLHPKQVGKWLVVFCDEINLPAKDEYGTQRAITFIRQMVEQGGFWRISDYEWITLEKICFIGACNPVSGSYGTYAGRVPLSHRFLRHSPVLLVDYPGKPSLQQIYGTFNRAVLRLTPRLRQHASALTESMIDFYLANQRKLTTEMQPFYIYSPRELSRWCRALVSILTPLNGDVTLEQLIRIFAHEALRLFQDRIIEDENRQWTNKILDQIIFDNFPTLPQEALRRPLLFSDWLTKDYLDVNRNELKGYIKKRLKAFYEEELDVKLVLFNEAIDHILRIDRVLKQPKGHALLVGASGAGKTVLSRFVAWVNGLSVFQIKISRKYDLENFDEDLRIVMKRAGLKGEKICFIFDESNILSSSFLERMNALLASGEVPGLFDEGEGMSGLLNQVREVAKQDGKLLDTDEELYQYFTKQVQNNLHVVFTMNPANADFSNRSVQSPALLNRCVLDYFGTWSNEAMYEVGYQFTKELPIDKENYLPPTDFPIQIQQLGDYPNHRQSLIASTVWVHNSVGKISKRLSKRQGRMNHITPRHYLDMINHYVKLFNEKTKSLKEQQTHLNIGLKKMQETQNQVDELQQELHEKEKELQKKQREADAKLKQMVKKQQEAESKKKQLRELESKLALQNKNINNQKEKAQSRLSKAQPAVEKAKKSVSKITKSSLDELRGYSKPKEPIKKTLLAVCKFLGHGDIDWTKCKHIMAQSTFIASILDFTTEKLDARCRDQIENSMQNDSEFSESRVKRASTPCSHLRNWLAAQIEYSKVIIMVDPLKREVRRLTQAANIIQVKLKEQKKMINNIERAIEQYAREYQELMTQSGQFKHEIKIVGTKVERSINLLKSLSEEQKRWSTESISLTEQLNTLPGDVLLSSAFLTYIGFFDQNYRENLLKQWKHYMKNMAINIKPNISLIEFLSLPEERLIWESNKLPVDALCTENAIILKRFNRYPLVIDPSGQATQFIMNHYRDKNIVKTSFVDGNLMKKLESALRFGTSILIEDAENVDLILNSVLNKETRRTGGRKLIRLGDQEIDLSPSFQMFMTTRDPTFNFTPDLCSRVTFCNFTITLTSLQSQCLNHTLKMERPDIDEARSNILKLQGEFKVKLRNLEKQLLKTLNEAEESILNDDKVLNTLVELKTDAEKIHEQSLQVDKTWTEIEQTSNEYQPFSLATSRLYFVLEQMSNIHYLYQFSLGFFLQIFHKVANIGNPLLQDEEDSMKRLEILSHNLYSTLFQRVARGLLHEDHLTFALRLAQIRLQQIEHDMDEDHLGYLLKGETIISGSRTLRNVIPKSLLTDSQVRQLEQLSDLKSFHDLPTHITKNLMKWKKFVSSNEPESNLPPSWENKFEDQTEMMFARLLLIKTLKPDRILSTGSQFVEEVLGKGFLTLPELDLKYIFESESNCKEPLLFCAQPGYDPSTKVDELQKQLGVELRTIAIGSQESYGNALDAVTFAAKSGTWVLIKNVHLSPQWLSELERLIHSLPSPEPTFRLFLTTEFHPKLPPTLLRISQIFVFEAPPGIKANLLHTYLSLSHHNISTKPLERARLYFLLSWFHSIVQERIRYRPLGWSKGYEFNESDQRTSLDTIDYWINQIGANKTNIDPNKIPWEAIRKLLGDTMYGGRVDNDFDQKLLDGMLQELFVPQCYDFNFKLVDYKQGENSFELLMPEGNRYEHFLNWIENLPSTENPTWLGLPKNAELLLLANQGKSALQKLMKIQNVYEDLDEMNENSLQTQEKDRRPTWMKNLEKNTKQWIPLLPNELPSLQGSKDSIEDPMWRCFNIEIKKGQKLLKIVSEDLVQLSLLCKGRVKHSGYLKNLLKNLDQGLVPNNWKQYPIDEKVGVDRWILDFGKRIEQLITICKSKDLGRAKGIWLGGLFDPTAFLTATRQAAAHAKEWSLETLQLQVSIDSKEKVTPQSFYLTELVLEGAAWQNNTLGVTDQISTTLPKVLFKWVKNTEIVKKNIITLPVYLNSTRLELLFAIDLPIPQNLSENIFYQLGTAIIIWKKEL